MRTPATLLLAALSFFITASAGAGVGIKNGGSAFDCGIRRTMMAEYVLALRFQEFEETEDRNLFFAKILARISNPFFKNILMQQWDRYGDSEFWPEGGLDGSTVLYYTTPSVIEAYGPDGRIPAKNPNDPICETTPIYEPSICCDRIVVSYFDAESPMPTKLRAHYRKLSRYQKNVLEMHEAVYRASRELGKLPPPEDPDYAWVKRETSAYRTSPHFTGEVPSANILTLTTNILSDEIESQADIEFHFQIYWRWSYDVYNNVNTR